jgi:hypothetical protein
MSFVCALAVAANILLLELQLPLAKVDEELEGSM